MVMQHSFSFGRAARLSPSPNLTPFDSFPLAGSVGSQNPLLDLVEPYRIFLKTLNFQTGRVPIVRTDENSNQAPYPHRGEWAFLVPL
jgi:hypothetical protein